MVRVMGGAGILQDLLIRNHNPRPFRSIDTSHELFLVLLLMPSQSVWEQWSCKQTMKHICVPGSQVQIHVPGLTVGTWASVCSLPLSSDPQGHLTSQVTPATSVLSKWTPAAFPVHWSTFKQVKKKPTNEHQCPWRMQSPEVFTFQINLPITAFGSLC